MREKEFKKATMADYGSNKFGKNNPQIQQKY